MAGRVFSSRPTGSSRSRVGTRVFGGVLATLMLAAGCSDDATSKAPANGASAPEAPAAAEQGAPATPSASPAGTPSTPTASPASDSRSEAERIAAGRSVYNANCIACHAMDPRQDGALGPAVAGSPLDLIEARVMRAEYPEGYQPKRTTRVMVPMPHLKDRLPELAAYLGSLSS